MSNDMPDAAAKLFFSLCDSGVDTDTAALRVKEEYGLDLSVLAIKQRALGWDGALGVKDLPDYDPGLPGELVIPWQGATMVLADIHAPYHHTKALERALIQARAEHIDYCVLLGDTMDNDAYSYYSGITPPKSMKELDKQMTEVYRVLTAIADTFKKVYVVRGNHDARPLKQLDKKLALKHFWKMFCLGEEGQPSIYDKFVITERYYCSLVDTPLGDWRMMHQKEYSRLRGRVAERYADVKYPDRHVMTTHEHHQAKLVVRDHWAIQTGCLQDSKKTEYKEMRDTLHPPWVIGWAWINELGVPDIKNYVREYEYQGGA